MIGNKTIGVAIPCYKGGKSILRTVLDSLEHAELVVVVDDACPLGTGDLLLKKINSPKLKVIFNKVNLGVGASTKIGFNWLIHNNIDLIIKIDADGQLNPSDIPRMSKPILKNSCECTKGNRFTSPQKIKLIPKGRLFGNLILSFMTKMSTGYWELFDPTNGFIVIKSDVLRAIDYKKTDDRYFFETDFLFRCALHNIIIENVSIEPIYNGNVSSLNPLNEIPNFLSKHFKLSIKRVLYQYFLLDFNPGSIELILSLLSSLIALLIGSFSFYRSHTLDILASSGTTSLFTIFCILAIQLFISFVYYDSTIRLIIRKSRTLC